MSLDLEFVSGDFLYHDLPVGKEYLRKYFDTPIEERFLVYHFIFGHIYDEKGFKYFHQLFMNHTGIVCCVRWARYLIKRTRLLERELKAATEAWDMEKVAEIRSGNWKNYLLK